MYQSKFKELYDKYKHRQEGVEDKDSELIESKKTSKALQLGEYLDKSIPYNKSIKPDTIYTVQVQDAIDNRQIFSDASNLMSNYKSPVFAIAYVVLKTGDYFPVNLTSIYYANVNDIPSITSVIYQGSINNMPQDFMVFDRDAVKELKFMVLSSYRSFERSMRYYETATENLSEMSKTFNEDLI